MLFASLFKAPYRTKAWLHISELKPVIPELKPRIGELKPSIEGLKLEISELKPSFIYQSWSSGCQN